MEHLFNKIQAITSQDKIELSDEVKKGIKDWLHLGNSSYAIEYDIYGDGHEHVSFVAKYIQSLREIYGIERNIRSMRIESIGLQADLMKAEHFEKNAESEWSKMKWKSKRLMAEHILTQRLVTIEDQLRQIEVHKKIHDKNKPLVFEKFQTRDEAEEFMNSYLMHYRCQKDGKKAKIWNIPLPPEKKAAIAGMYRRHDGAVNFLMEQGMRFGKLPPPNGKIKADVESGNSRKASSQPGADRRRDQLRSSIP